MPVSNSNVTYNNVTSAKDLSTASSYSETEQLKALRSAVGKLVDDGLFGDGPHSVSFAVSANSDVGGSNSVSVTVTSSAPVQS